MMSGDNVMVHAGERSFFVEFLTFSVRIGLAQVSKRSLSEGVIQTCKKSRNE